MFYKYSSFVGRLAPATPNQAYYPQGINSPAQPEPATFQFDSVKTRPIEVPSVAAASVSGQGGDASFGVVPSGEGYKKIRQLQTRFSAYDALFIWQKRGLTDRSGYVISMVLVGVCTLYGCGSLYKMVLNQK